jgi:hypothetical protein
VAGPGVGGVSSHGCNAPASAPTAELPPLVMLWCVTGAGSLARGRTYPTKVAAAASGGGGAGSRGGTG